MLDHIAVSTRCERARRWRSLGLATVEPTPEEVRDEGGDREGELEKLHLEDAWD